MKIKNNKQSENFDKLKIKRHSDQRLVFNFSFLTLDNKYNLNSHSKTINKNIRLKLLEKIYQLSQVDINTVLGYKKEQGLEKISEAEMKSFNMHPDFIKSRRKNECDEYCWIFRLSKKGRVIGKMNDNIFYIIKIDTDFKSYNH